eukprot:jgi/Mesvir1/26064/Mv06790-RA.1
MPMPVSHCVGIASGSVHAVKSPRGASRGTTSAHCSACHPRVQPPRPPKLGRLADLAPAFNPIPRAGDSFATLLRVAGLTVAPRRHISIRRVPSSMSASPPSTSTASQEVEPLSKPAVLSADEVVRRLRAAVHPAAANTFLAMYSSVLGGIVTDPALMVLPIDDHMVHRGHSVFDTAAVFDNCMYELEPHLDRFLVSARMAKIPLPFPRETLRQLVIDTTAAALAEHAARRARAGTNGAGDDDVTSGWQTDSGSPASSHRAMLQIRMWLSVGPGGFSLSPKECVGPTFYVMVAARKSFPPVDAGMAVVTSSVPPKPVPFSVLKSTNYMPNALVEVEAEAAGADHGIWVDGEGYVMEGPSMNVAFVLADGSFVTPPFDKVLAGVTVQTVMRLAAGMVDPSAAGKGGSTPTLTAVNVRRVSVVEARAAREMMLVGSGVLVSSVTSWDGKAVGDGTPPTATETAVTCDETFGVGLYQHSLQTMERK